MNDAEVLEGWHFVGALSSFAENEIRPIQVKGLEVIILKTTAGVFCLNDECAHQPVRLSEFGEASGGRLICHAHGAQYDLLESGKPLCFPAVNPLKAWPVRTFKGDIYIKI
ncbi:MAG: Rieske 2Fe-2S domain-containing protein [Proteobacteria bacterium]|nr:Rieske 2Fe-2S domain-containing protein [Pseudomonadota bacterium]